MSPDPTFIARNARQESIPPPYSNTNPTTPDMLDSLPTSRTPMPSSPPYKPQSFLAPKADQRRGFFRRHIRLWRAIPCALAAFFWATQMIYFFFYFITRKSLEDGSWPRLSPTYAMFPFISCVGGARQLVFRSSSITVASLLWIGFGIDLVVGSRSPVGIWWRRGKFVTASISNVFLIALTFANTASDHTLHLTLASFQIFFMGNSKACDWHLAAAMRERTPNNKFLQRAKLWKRIAVIPAMPCGCIALTAMYFCTAKFENGRVIFTPFCWSTVSFGAPAEWLLSWCWVVFLFTVAYDSYHLDYTVDLLLRTPPPPKKKSHGFAFWRRWTQKNPTFEKKMEAWESSRQGLVGAAAPLAGDGSVGPSHVDARGGSGDGQLQRPKSYARVGVFGEEVDEHDISSRRYDGDAEYPWLPPNMPLSVFGTGKYQKLGSSPRVGEPLESR